MKILFFTHYSSLYGANRSLLNIIDGLRNKIKPYVVLPTNGELVNELKQRGVPYFIRTFESSFEKPENANFKRFRQRLKHYPRLFRLVFKLKPNIIYTNTSAIEYGLVISKLLGIKHVWHIREFGWEDYNVVHDYGEKIQKYLLRLSNINIAISNIIRVKVLENNKNSITIYNGPISISQLKKPRKQLSEELVFAVIGYIGKGKNQLEALNAFYIFQKKKRNSKILFIGDGDEKYLKELKEKSLKLNIQNSVFFKGYIDNINNELEKIDCLIMCSKSEAFGRVTIEAMACGIPVIGKNTGATPEIITDGFDGLLYGKNEVGLAKKMIELICVPKKYEEFSKNAINTVREKFTTENYVRKIHQLLMK